MLTPAHFACSQAHGFHPACEAASCLFACLQVQRSEEAATERQQAVAAREADRAALLQAQERAAAALHDLLECQEQSEAKDAELLASANAQVSGFFAVQLAQERGAHFHAQHCSGSCSSFMLNVTQAGFERSLCAEAAVPGTWPEITIVCIHLLFSQAELQAQLQTAHEQVEDLSTQSFALEQRVRYGTG